MTGEQHAALRRDIRATLMPGFAGFTMPEWLPEFFESGMLSVCVYGENVRDAAQLRALGAELRTARPEALIAIDEEGGEVTRLHYLDGSPYPGAAVMGRIDDLDYTRSIGERVGRDILSAGFNLALGPIADVNSNPQNPVIGTRSFSSEPELAARHVAAWIEGLQSTGAVACAKHFPGHGDTAQDSHLALPTVDAPQEVLRHRELPPFRAAVNANVASVMTSHILLPQLDPSGPATFSRVVLQGLLRDELDFEGVIVSDALDMQGASGEIGIPEAAVRALAAGCDLLCLGTNTGPALMREIEDAVLAAIGEGRLSESRLADAAGEPQELERIIASFDGVDRARDWLAEHPHAAVIRVDSEANMAVGHAPWGPFAAGLDTARLAHDAASPAWGEAYPNGAIVIGRDLHRLPFASVGIGVPGQVDPRLGEIRYAYNLRVESLALAALLGERTGLDVTIDNDVTAAAIGAAHLMGLDGCVAYVNLGTGLSAGIVVDGHPWRGARGQAGEIGHLPIDPRQRPCPCGQRGCLETVASGSALKSYWPAGGEHPGWKLAGAAEQGDEGAREALELLIDGAASAVRAVGVTIAPDTVVVGGGLRMIGDPLIEGIRGRLASWERESSFLAGFELSDRLQALPQGTPAATVGAALSPRV